MARRPETRAPRTRPGDSCGKYILAQALGEQAVEFPGHQATQHRLVLGFHQGLHLFGQFRRFEAVGVVGLFAGQDGSAVKEVGCDARPFPAAVLGLDVKTHAPVLVVGVVARQHRLPRWLGPWLAAPFAMLAYSPARFTQRQARGGKPASQESANADRRVWRGPEPSVGLEPEVRRRRPEIRIQDLQRLTLAAPGSPGSHRLSLRHAFPITPSPSTRFGPIDRAADSREQEPTAMTRTISSQAFAEPLAAEGGSKTPAIPGSVS